MLYGNLISSVLVEPSIWMFYLHCLMMNTMFLVMTMLTDYGIDYWVYIIDVLVCSCNHDSVIAIHSMVILLADRDLDTQPCYESIDFQIIFHFLFYYVHVFLCLLV